MDFLSNFASPSRNHPQERSHFRSILLAFAGNGMQTGVWVVLIPDLAGALRLSASALGVALATLAAAQMAGVVLGGWLADRMGRRPFLVLGAAGAGLFYLLLTLVGSYIALLSLSVLCGLTLGFLDMVLNTLGGDHERQHNTKVMSLFHAGHDGASSCGALALGFRTVYVTLGALFLLLAVVSIRLPIPSHELKRKHAAQPSEQEHERQTPPWLLKSVILAAVFVGLISLTEAAFSGYGNIYLRDILGSSPLMGAVGISGLLAASHWGAWRATLP
jgi:MFS family permease